MRPKHLLIWLLACPLSPALAEDARPLGSEVEDTPGRRVYLATCAACHDNGSLGAPRIGDRKAWKGRIAEGKRMQVRMAIKGIRKMPPRGGNPALSDQEVEQAVVYLLNQSGARFN